MQVNDIFYEENYEEYADFANNNNLIISEIEPDENGRRFQLVKIPSLTEEEILEDLRFKREVECFSVINRGQLWYDTLTEQQTKELKVWYQEWLDVTKTKQEPKKPDWLEV